MAAASAESILTTIKTGGLSAADEAIGSPIGETLKKGKRAKEKAGEMAALKEAEQQQMERDLALQEKKTETQASLTAKRNAQRAARAAKTGRQSTILTSPTGAISDYANIIPEKTLLGT